MLESFSEHSERFARRAREFSDAVARLGQIRRIDAEVVRLFEEIKEKRILCEQAEKTLERYLRMEAGQDAGSRRQVTRISA